MQGRRDLFFLGGVGQDFLSSPDTRVIGLHDFRFRFVLIERRDKGGTCSVVHNEPRFWLGRNM